MSPARHAGPLFLLAAILIIISGCANTDPEPTVAPVDKVLLISIDTLRPDFLSSYNPELDTSPNIDRFASEGTIFTDVLAHASSTARSHKSILYSLYPSVHKTSKSTIPEEKLVSPLETLQQAGFTTTGIVGGGQLKAEFGFSKGFDEYIELPSITRANQIEAFEKESFRWLGEHRDDKFFLFLHTYEPHCPYSPPEEYAAKRAGWYEGEVDPGKCGARYYNKVSMEDEDYRFVRDLYAAEVEYVDSALGRLFDELKRLGLYDEMMIIFTSDHGESLGERRYVGHNRPYNVQLRVPLIIKLPGVAPSRVDAPLESIDVMPTVFAAVGLEPPYGFQGVNLIPLMKGEGQIDVERIRIATHPNLVSVHRGPWHLIYSPNAKRVELYNLSVDPDELSNVAEANRHIARELRDYYDEMNRHSRELAANFTLRDGGAPILDDQTREELRALGYIQ